MDGEKLKEMLVEAFRMGIISMVDLLNYEFGSAPRFTRIRGILAYVSEKFNLNQFA
jgi:hypothetical protein